VEVLAEVLTAMEPLRRPDLYVVVRLLEKLRSSDRNLNRTQLQIASGMNYSQFERYLGLILQRGLAEMVDNGEGTAGVRLTRKGYDSLMLLVQGLQEILGTEPFRRQ